MGISEVVSLLTNPSEDGVSTPTPVKPKAGEMIIYRSDKEAEQGSCILKVLLSNGSRMRIETPHTTTVYWELSVLGTS